MIYNFNSFAQLKIYIVPSTIFIMEFKEDVKRFAPLIITLILAVLAFFLVRPFLIPVIAGLILAYAFNPLYKKTNAYIKNRSISAGIMLIILLLVIAIPIWILTPIIINQAFNLFQTAQSADFSAIAARFFPTASKDFVAQMAVTMDSLVGKVSSVVLNILANLFFNAVKIGVGLIITAFVLFYALKDSDKIEKTILKLSPLGRAKEKILIKQFKDITSAIVYGQIAIGLIQGSLAGLGLFLFNVPNALILTIAAIFLSVIPIMGPSPIWIPVAVYMFFSGDVGLGIAFLAYNIFIVSTVDNIIRTYFVSKKMKMSPVLVLLGMIGGVFLFGILGIILGPLILAYLITFWESYRDSGSKSILISENHK